MDIFDFLSIHGQIVSSMELSLSLYDRMIKFYKINLLNHRRLNKELEIWN